MRIQFALGDTTDRLTSQEMPSSGPSSRWPQMWNSAQSIREWTTGMRTNNEPQHDPLDCTISTDRVFPVTDVVTAFSWHRLAPTVSMNGTVYYQTMAQKWSCAAALAIRFSMKIDLKDKKYMTLKVEEHSQNQPNCWLHGHLPRCCAQGLRCFHDNFLRFHACHSIIIIINCFLFLQIIQLLMLLTVVMPLLL